MPVFCFSIFFFSTPCLYSANPKRVHSSFLDYPPVPVIKELSPHSKLILLYFSLGCCHWGSVTTFLLCLMLPAESCQKEALEGDCEQGWRGEGTCSSCLFPVCLTELPVPVNIAQEMLLHPHNWMHIEVFATVAETTASHNLRDTSSSQAGFPHLRSEFQLHWF